MVAPPAVPGDDFRMTKMSPNPRRALARMAANEGERDMRILVIEDDTKTGEYLKKGLGESGYAVDWSQHGADGLYLALENRYDLVVLDVMLPGLDGWQIMEVLRKKHDVPVLFLTARDQLQDRIRGLELGADDYLVKPFSFTELLLRIRTLLRRGVVREAEQVQLADLQLDVLRRKVSRQGQVIALTNKEFALLHLLMRREGEVLSWLSKGKTNRDIAQILGLSPRTVDKHLEQIYAKLGVENRTAAAAIAVNARHRKS